MLGGHNVTQLVHQLAKAVHLLCCSEALQADSCHITISKACRHPVDTASVQVHSTGAANAKMTMEEPHAGAGLK